MNALDIETYVNNQKVVAYCIVCFFKKLTYSKYGKGCIYELIKLLFSLEFKNEIVYIHNLNFDGFLIIESLSDKDMQFDIFSKKLNIYSITIRYVDKIITLKCSYKILPLSLHKIAQIFNLENKMPFPYKFITSDNIYYTGPTPDQNFFNSKKDYEIFKCYNSNFINVREYTLKYCENDVLITVKFLINIFKILKKFKINAQNTYSAPSLALKIFEKRFNTNNLKFKFNKLIDNFARKAYFGGRCEVYGNQKKDEFVFHFDFSGMYAQCMKEKFPFGKYNLNLNAKKIEIPGIYWIEFISNENIIFPILPHHRFNDKKLMFTNGIMVGAYWFEEILLFIKYGGIVTKILYSLEFERYDYVFNEYIDFFSLLRQKSEAYNVFGKLMINSVYGRLGMNDNNEYTFVEKKTNFNLIKKKINLISYKELNNIVLVQAELDKQLKQVINLPDSVIKNNIIIAAAITSKARIKLYEAQQAVIQNGGRLLYSDTDSIFAAYRRDVSNETHGEVFWDTAKNDTKIKEAIFFSPKSYALKYDNDKYSIKIKGYNQKNISFDEIKKCFQTNQKIILNNYTFLNKRDLNLFYSEIYKNFDLNAYDKRYFINEYDTKPYYYSNYQYNKTT